jgi:hypothetical protein
MSDFDKDLENWCKDPEFKAMYEKDKEILAKKVAKAMARDRKRAAVRQASSQRTGVCQKQRTRSAAV